MANNTRTSFFKLSNNLNATKEAGHFYLSIRGKSRVTPFIFNNNVTPRPRDATLNTYITKVRELIRCQEVSKIIQQDANASRQPRRSANFPNLLSMTATVDSNPIRGGLLIFIKSRRGASWVSFHEPLRRRINCPDASASNRHRGTRRSNFRYVTTCFNREKSFPRSKLRSLLFFFPPPLETICNHPGKYNGIFFERFTKRLPFPDSSKQPPSTRRRSLEILFPVSSLRFRN